MVETKWWYRQHRLGLRAFLLAMNPMLPRPVPDALRRRHEWMRDALPSHRDFHYPSSEVRGVA